jgi:hypothetical protein
MKIKEDLIDILNDHKSNLIKIIDEIWPTDQNPLLVKEVETEHDRMATEVNELLGSSYD